MPEVILVTEGVFARAAEVFRADSAELIEATPAGEELLAAAVSLSQCRAVIVGTDRYRGTLYQALAAAGTGRGAIIARFGVGHDGIDKGLAREYGILVTNTPGTLDDSVAEHTLWLLGSLARHISRSDAGMRAGQFSAPMGWELRGKTLGVLGFGGIGRRVAAAAHFGFGLRVLAVGTRSVAELEQHERRPLAELLASCGVAHYTNQLDEVLAAADIISLHIPATPQTRHLLDAQRLRQLKPGALLVNTARGAVLDEAALYDALAERRLGGAALDVFEQEPYSPVTPGKDLRTLDNVVLTPHTGSNTREANRRMAAAALENVRNFLAGRWEKLNRVDR